MKPDLTRTWGYVDAQVVLYDLQWDKVLDFCERLYSHCAQEVSRCNEHTQEREIVVSRSDAQEYIAVELQRLFLEEHLAFEFSKGLVRRRGRHNTADQVSRTGLVLGDPRLASALTHFNKSLKYFQNPSQPDFENVVKEAVCAVEATARVLFPSAGPTLGEIVQSLTRNEMGQLPKAIAKTFEGLYGFRSGGEGVAHGGATGGAVTKEIAEYTLALAASQIVFLVDFAEPLQPDVPF